MQAQKSKACATSTVTGTEFARPCEHAGACGQPETLALRLALDAHRAQGQWVKGLAIPNVSLFSSARGRAHQICCKFQAPAASVD